MAATVGNGIGVVTPGGRVGFLDGLDGRLAAFELYLSEFQVYDGARWSPDDCWAGHDRPLVLCATLACHHVLVWHFHVGGLPPGGVHVVCCRRFDARPASSRRTVFAFGLVFGLDSG